MAAIVSENPLFIICDLGIVPFNVPNPSMKHKKKFDFYIIFDIDKSPEI